MNANTEHQVELLQLPSPEHDFFSLISSYEQFFNLNLDYFDRVISTKYPAWMVQHRNHCMYMLHPLRGLYDTYTSSENIPDFSKETLPGKIAALSDTKHTITKEDVSKIFDLVRYASQDSSAEKKYFTFPGPLARQVVHALDRFALHGNKIKRFGALSHTVRTRPNYFPSDKAVEVISPPSSLSVTPTERSEYFFSVSRFDEPKRMDLIIKAYLQSGVNIPLKLAGTGPTLDRCKALAKGIARIEFLGFVSNHVLAELYGNAVATIFVPIDEDYGLVTIESFVAGRAVITCEDSGGVTEHVTEGVTGWVVKPNARDLARAIAAAAADVSGTLLKGRNGANYAANITWKRLSDWTSGSVE